MKELNVSARFTIEGWEKSFKGYTNEGEHWNGWACPYFEENEVKEIFQLSECSNNEKIVTELNGKTYVYYDDIDDEEERIIEGIKFKTPDGVKTLFPLGNCEWVWEKVPEEDFEPTLSALVEKSDHNPKQWVVIIHKDGVDTDWWGVYWGTKKACESLANEMNTAFKRLKI